ncbi:MAG: transglycosylase SLT domain-containing protein [Nitrospiraceae bacterium]
MPTPSDHQVGEQETPAIESTPVQASALQTQAHVPTLLEQFAEQFIAWDQALRAPKSADQAFKERISQIPMARNRKVERHIRYFQTDNRERFTQWLARLNHYKPLVEQIFAEFDLPPDLVYLSLIESGFNPRAYSRARATGPWQFMKGTGKHYGLRVNWYVDERRDPMKSTVAAARYLRDMYDLFGSWPLALAAYNAGERKVQRALRKARAESYWEIAQTRYLRRETREYVPKFMAAAIIAKNPEQFGFNLEQPDVHQFDEVTVRRSVHLQAVARATGIPYPELRRLNPELRRKVTPPYDSEYYLKVPAGTKETVEKAFSGIKTWQVKKSGKNGKGWYKVRVGDSLWKIARRFRTTVAELKALNNLMSHRIKPGDLLAISP